MGSARGIRLSAYMLTATFGLKVSITLKAHHLLKPFEFNVKYYHEQSGRICKMKMVG